NRHRTRSRTWTRRGACLADHRLHFLCDLCVARHEVSAGVDCAAGHGGGCVLPLRAAGSASGCVEFIVRVTNPFYAPFRGIVASPTTDQGHTLLLPIVIAIIAYVLLHLAINGLLRMLAHRKTQI